MVGMIALCNTALSHAWKPNDRVRSLIDEKWWLGRVVAQEPLDSASPHSRFMCYTVIWDENDVTEQVSPWDLEPVPSAHFKDGALCETVFLSY